jgi:uncharacterized protein (TIGR02145 family)
MMCWYNHEQATYTANNFGALYNWYAVNPSTNGNRNVCPLGWHVPTDSEWSTLINYLDPNANGGDNSNNAGGKMKSTQYWQDGTNESGFSGLPAGGRASDGIFYYTVFFWCGWWSSTEWEDLNYFAWRRHLAYGDARREFESKESGFSVRCIKD